MKIIYSKNTFQEIHVDDEMYELLSKYSWYVYKDGNTFYAQTFLTIEGVETSKKMHRVIMEINDPIKFVDHIDGNGLNNTRQNLRLCSNSENMMNRGKQSNNTSGYKGVTWHKGDKKWQAQLLINRKMKYLGSFKNPIDAAKAYDDAAKNIFGEFAKLNFKK